MITARFSDLTSEIEQEILIAGEESWGKVSWVSTFLRPLYHIVTNVLVRGEVSITYIQEKEYNGRADLLIQGGFVTSGDTKSLSATNKLTKLQDINFEVWGYQRGFTRIRESAKCSYEYHS